MKAIIDSHEQKQYFRSNFKRVYLIVPLYTLGQRVVDDKPHVHLVDPHPEGDGGAHHPHLVLHPKVLSLRSGRLHQFILTKSRLKYQPDMWV